MSEWKSIPTEMVVAMIAAAGGVAKYLHSYTQGQPFAFTMLIANVFVSGFSGFIFAQVAIIVGGTEKLLFVAAGVGGFMGASSIDYIRAWLVSRFSINEGRGPRQ